MATGHKENSSSKKTYLDQVLALGLGDQRLQLGCRKGVHESSLRDDKQKDLSAGENRELVGLCTLVVSELGLNTVGFGQKRSDAWELRLALEAEVSASCGGDARRDGRPKRETGIGRTNLLHNTGLALGKGDVATRLVGDELDLNLATLAATFLIIVVVVVGGDAGSRALGATGVARRVAIADRVGVVEVVGRSLIVLVGDVGHF